MNYEDDKSTVATNFKSSPVIIPENGVYVRLSGTRQYGFPAVRGGGFLYRV